ncbi:hypothetical protein [Kangiella sp. M94]
MAVAAGKYGAFDLGSNMISEAFEGRPRITDVSGFKNELIADGQNGDVGRHIYAAAGGEIIGVPLSFYGNIQDLAQYVASGFQRDQSLAEIKGNNAGQKVGEIMKEAALNDCKSRGAIAKPNTLIRQILCNG